MRRRKRASDSDSTDERNFFFELVIVLVILWVAIEFVKGALTLLFEAWGVDMKSWQGQLIVVCVLALIGLAIVIYQDNLIHAFVSGDGGPIDPVPSVDVL